MCCLVLMLLKAGDVTEREGEDERGGMWRRIKIEWMSTLDQCWREADNQKRQCKHSKRAQTHAGREAENKGERAEHETRERRGETERSQMKKTLSIADLCWFSGFSFSFFVLMCLRFLIAFTGFERAGAFREQIVRHKPLVALHHTKRTAHCILHCTITNLIVSAESRTLLKPNSSEQAM
jgi:hypothetical protein